MYTILNGNVKTLHCTQELWAFKYLTSFAIVVVLLLCERVFNNNRKDVIKQLHARVASYNQGLEKCKEI